jgi:hypothetical protein
LDIINARPHAATPNEASTPERATHDPSESHVTASRGYLVQLWHRAVDWRVGRGVKVITRQSRER